MVPPDGARTNRIPALSWDSVVDTTDQPAAAPAAPPTAAAAAVVESVTLAPLALDLSSPAELDSPAVDAPVAIEPMHLESPPAVATTLAPTPESPTPETTPSTLAESPIADEPTTIRTTPPAVIVPALGDVTSGPDQLTPAAVAASAPTPVAPTTDALPEIQEATPVVYTGGPLLPSVPAAVPRPAVATSFEFDPASVAPAPTRQAQRRGKRRGLKLLATLIVLGGVVAAGVVFGQSYLFPGAWDSTTAPYADAVEAGRGVDFAEPLAIVGESTDDFSTRLGTQLATVSAEELSQWRALGLVSGAVDETSLARQLTGWQDALYSTADGQVYHDLGVTGAELDAQLVQEMTAASLDQEFDWSVEQPQRTLDAAAATSAEVLRQSRVVQQSSAFGAAVPPVSSELVSTLPPVIGYRTLAPHVFAEFDASIEPGDRTNPLADLGTEGPGILGRDASIVATGPTMPDGDSVTTSPVAKDRSFWFLVFAGYLDARTAHTASDAVVESALAGAARGATLCVSATFSGSGVEQTATLRSALTAWAAAAPAEMSSSFQVLPDGTLQLVSCDPGVGLDAAARPAVARELLAWRMAELATMEAVRVGGGGEAELVDAWAFVQASPVAIDLTTLPPSASPAEMAAAARDAVNALFTPAG